MDSDRSVISTDLPEDQVRKFWEILKLINFPSVEKMNIESVAKLLSIVGRDLLYKWILNETCSGKEEANFDYFFTTYGICSKNECLTFLNSEKLDICKQIEILNKTFLILLLNRKIEVTTIVDLLPDLYPNYKKVLDNLYKLSICSRQVNDEICTLQKYADDLRNCSAKYPQSNINNTIIKIDENITKMLNFCEVFDNIMSYFGENNYDFDETINDRLAVIIKCFKNFKIFVQHVEEIVKVYN